MAQLNSLEKAVLTKMFDGEHPTLARLRQQLRDIEVSGRRLTGVGFFTELRVASKAASIGEGRRVRFGDVVADVSGLKHGAGFVLYVDDGLIVSLEGYSFDEPWPSDIAEFTLRFSSEQRDLGALEVTRE